MEIEVPDVIVLNETDFLEWYISRGGNGVLEPVPAVALHNTVGITIMASSILPQGTARIRRQRRWFRITPPAIVLRSLGELFSPTGEEPRREIISQALGEASKFPGIDPTDVARIIDEFLDKWLAKREALLK